MAQTSNTQLRDEQAKAQHLFARWRKDELLYKEDAKERETHNKSNES